MRAKPVLTAVGQAEASRPYYLCADCHHGQLPAPTSVAPPYQTVFDPATNSSGTAAYANYDGYGRVNYVYPPQGAARNTKTYYAYSYGRPWTITANTQIFAESSYKLSAQTQTLDGLRRVVSVSTTANSSPVSEVDTAYTPCACSPLGKMSSGTLSVPKTGPPALDL